MRSPYMTPEEIAGSRPFAFAADQSTPLERARQRMIATGQWNGAQAMGRRWAIGCVALEITQRCNLDCSLCYLSENAEAIRDVPLPELFRRIDEIRSIYGPKTDIQVTGGDPTLRRRDELVAIVRRIRDRGMRPALFTNGIRASRDLLSELAQAGLVDVAFHVDMTQGRRGYCSEVELNVLRRDYIEQARGLQLAVIFNTTVFAGNFAEIPGVAAFLTAHSDIVAFASFQLQADTGRGTERERASCITPDSVAEAICRGIGSRLSFGFPAAGHVRCNQYAMALVCNGRAYDFYDDRDFATLALEATAGLQFERRSRRRAVVSSLAWALRHPRFIAPASRWLARKLWRMRYDLIAARGRINKISFFIHNFMDACRLERDRIDGCAFMVASADGPLSMCLHNARRDEFLLKPTRIATEDGPTFWNPVTGELQQDPQPAGAPEVPTRRRKGRGRV